MPTTSNFGWTTPADTDLVKDGAAAIRTLGNGIDNSLVDLKGGTTGQVLAKASNTDLDFTWTNGGDITEVAAGVGINGGGTSGSVTITNSMATAIDAKGDLIVGTGADTFSKLTVGANDTVLVADSSTATGLKWGTVSSPIKQIVSVNSDSYTSISPTAYADITGLTASITPTSASSSILVFATVPTNLANQSNTVADVKFKLFRGATELEEWTRVMRIDAGTGSSGFIQLAGNFATIYKDSPSSTSSLTYKFQFACTGSNASAAASVGGMMSIILVEV